MECVSCNMSHGMCLMEYVPWNVSCRMSHGMRLVEFLVECVS